MPDKTQGLSLESLGLLNHLHGVLTQPPGEWNGFYEAQSPTMNFALRYQLAFASYALAAMAARTPAFRAPYAEALRAAIERMLNVAAWGYWRAPEAAPAAGHAGHVAVLLSPHQRTPAGPPSDPIARDNLQYSGHLGTMLGLYEKTSGDSRYDSPFSLADPASGVQYTYTHSQVAERLYEQMRRNNFGGVCCEPGMAYVPCNNHALASNTLHDALHGTHYAEANAGWLETVRRKMVLKGPAVRGVFGASYVKDLHAAAPVAFNFTDAWGLAFMLPFDRALVRNLYPRFRRKVSWEDKDCAFVDSSSFSEKAEISDVALNTGFALILARGIGDAKLAGALARYAADAFQAGWRGSSHAYWGAARTLHSTALFALAKAVRLGGEDFTRLFNDSPDPGRFGKPHLAAVSSPSGAIGVSRAEWQGAGDLYVELRQVASPHTLANAASAEIRLVLANVPEQARLEIDGQEIPSDGLTRLPNGSLVARARVEPLRPTVCRVIESR